MSKVGTWALRKILMPSATLISPMNEVSSGLSWWVRETSTSAWAVAVGSLIACGVRMASTPSQLGSSISACAAAA